MGYFAERQSSFDYEGRSRNWTRPNTALSASGRDVGRNNPSKKTRNVDVIWCLSSMSQKHVIVNQKLICIP